MTFATLQFILYELKNLFKIIKILFQIRDINIFVFRGVFFSRYVQLKSFIFNKKASAVKSETKFSRKAIEN